MSIPDRLRAARDGVCSARELDRLAGLTPCHTSLIESGRRPNPESDTLRAIATTLGVSLDWLVLGVGDPPRAEDVRAAVERARGGVQATGTEG